MGGAAWGFGLFYFAFIRGRQKAKRVSRSATAGSDRMLALSPRRRALLSLFPVTEDARGRPRAGAQPCLANLAARHRPMDSRARGHRRHDRKSLRLPRAPPRLFSLR